MSLRNWLAIVVPLLAFSASIADSADIACPTTRSGKPLISVRVYSGPPENNAEIVPRHGGWDHSRAKAALKSLEKFYDERIDLSALRG